MPPLVPGGTCLHGAVIRIGFCLASMPSSDASVSARHVAWCASTAQERDEARGDSEKSGGDEAVRGGVGLAKTMD